MFKVVQTFFDLTDGNMEYHPGDVFPRDGLEVSAERLEQLATSSNRLGCAVIEEVKEQQEEKQTRKRVRKNAD